MPSPRSKSRPRRKLRRWDVHDKDRWDTHSIMRMDKLKKWVSDMHEKTNHFGWFEDMYSCECHGPKCFACRYQLQQRNIIGMTEMRRKLLKHIRIIETRIDDIVLATAVKDKLNIIGKQPSSLTRRSAPFKDRWLTKKE